MKTKMPHAKASLQNAVKAMLGRRFIAVSAYRKKERSQTHNLTFHPNKLEKEDQAKPETSRGNKIIKIRVKINKIERIGNKKENQGNQKLYFKINKIGEALLPSQELISAHMLFRLTIVVLQTTPNH